VAQFPDSIIEWLVAIADEREFGEVAEGIGGALVAYLASDAHPAECMKQLGVYQMRGMEVAVCGEALDQTRHGVPRRERLQHGRRVNHEHCLVAVATGAYRGDDRSALRATGARACALQQLGHRRVFGNSLQLAKREIRERYACCRSSSAQCTMDIVGHVAYLDRLHSLILPSCMCHTQSAPLASGLRAPKLPRQLHEVASSRRRQPRITLLRSISLCYAPYQSSTREFLMAAAADRPTRVSSDLLDSAVVEGAKENRSAKQQLEHWARVGRSVCARQTASRHRVEAAMAGVLPVEHLSDEEGIVFDSDVQSRLEARLRTTNLGAVLAARGVTTVALNEQGELTEYRPDGTSASV
jgi:ParD-like antitoxin of type II ParDE toxin-antitoxin system